MEYIGEGPHKEDYFNIERLQMISMVHCIQRVDLEN